MKQIPSLPVELLADIVNYLTPHTPIIGRDAAWTPPSDLLNWWDGQYWKPQSMEGLYRKRDSSTYSSVEIAVSPYASLLTLRQANKQFNAICVPLLYKDFNCLKRHTTVEDIEAEVLSLYHCHIRMVRTTGSPEGNPLVDTGYKHLLSFLTQRVTALAVYYDYRESISHELEWFNDEIARVLDTGQIISFGVYSNLAFSEYSDTNARGAKSLLRRITITTPLLNRLVSLDIAVEAMEEDSYDAFRTQIEQLDSLTMRTALQDDLGKVWDMKQRHKWFPCHNLTNLQLIECPAVSASHIPHLLQFFPSLRTLALISCGEVGEVSLPQALSFAKDSVWRGRAPLESLHIEHIFEWEIKVLGVIHTRELTISLVIDDEGIVNCFRDEDLYPGLQILHAEKRHINAGLEEICGRRGIVLDSNARVFIYYE